MVQHLNPQQFPGLDKALIQAQVLVGRLQAARGVVMGQDDACGQVLNGRLKNLARMHEIIIKRAYGNYVPFYFLVARIQIKSDEVFLFIIPYIPKKNVL